YYLDRYPDAAAALESFLQTNANDPEADLWREQLRIIRAREARKESAEPAQLSDAAEDRIFSGREVTTKARVLAKVEPTYTESARQAGVTGTVILRAVFSGKGEVTNIFVTQALSYGLNLKAVTAAKAIRFVPATKDGKPVSMWMELQYNFNLY
ncbi:MAG TPA: energy transducer TonB, partial [Pyrinomonadaceae bacterium]|nr:energy transducer TonB [Pyrinomonadaceae bacterium]